MRRGYDFGITARTQPNEGGDHPQGGYVTVIGKTFTPRGKVTITYIGIPNRPRTMASEYPPPVVISDGSFVFKEPWNCTSADQSDLNTDVYIYARDESTG